MKKAITFLLLTLTSIFVCIEAFYSAQNGRLALEEKQCNLNVALYDQEIELLKKDLSVINSAANADLLEYRVCKANVFECEWEKERCDKEFSSVHQFGCQSDDCPPGLICRFKKLDLAKRETHVSNPFEYISYLDEVFNRSDLKCDEIVALKKRHLGELREVENRLKAKSSGHLQSCLKDIDACADRILKCNSDIIAACPDSKEHLGNHKYFQRHLVEMNDSGKISAIIDFKRGSRIIYDGGNPEEEQTLLERHE